MSQILKTSLFKRIAAVLMLLALAIVLFPCCYLTAFRQLDAVYCYGKASRNLGIEASYEALVEYIDSSISTGMSREQVMDKLREVGPVRIRDVEYFSADDEYDQRYYEEVIVELCFHPLNNFDTWFGYVDNHLIYYGVVQDSP